MTNMRKHVGAVAVTLLGYAAVIGACGDTDATGNAMVVTSTEYAFTVDQAPKPGLNTVTLKNAGKAEHRLSFIRLDEGKTLSDVVQVLSGQSVSIPPWAI